MGVGEKGHEVGLIGTGGGWCKCFQRGGAVIRPGKSTHVALYSSLWDSLRHDAWLATEAVANREIGVPERGLANQWLAGPIEP